MTGPLPSPPPRRLLVVVSAPSGAGKTTLCNGLMECSPAFDRAITCTTRAPRPGETQGVDYHFLTVEEFQKRLAAGEFLEHATVHGSFYGTLRQEVASRLAAGRDVLLNIDVQGAAAMRAQAPRDPVLGPAMVSVFLMPSSVEELERRLRNRAQDAPEVIARRLDAARHEMAHAPAFDYVMVSGSVAEDLRRLQVIIEAERLRVPRPEAPS